MPHSSQLFTTIPSSQLFTVFPGQFSESATQSSDWLNQSSELTIHSSELTYQVSDWFIQLPDLKLQVSDSIKFIGYKFNQLFQRVHGQFLYKYWRNMYIK